MMFQLIDTLYSKVQVSLKIIAGPTLDWNTLFHSKPATQRKTLKFSASPDAYDNRLNAASRKREIPSRSPRG